MSVPTQIVTIAQSNDQTNSTAAALSDAHAFPGCDSTKNEIIAHAFYRSTPESRGKLEQDAWAADTTNTIG